MIDLDNETDTKLTLLEKIAGAVLAGMVAGFALWAVNAGIVRV